MLEFRNITFHYPEDNYEMFRDLSFRIQKGDFASVIGASGCGKSTILRLVNGLEKAEKGEILVDGSAIGAQKNYCAYMPQKDLLFPWRSIRKNVCLPMEIQGVGGKEQNRQAEEMLQEVGLLDYADKYPKDLSGGMRQRASFARTLLTGSDLLLLDEPFSALDSLTRMALQEWLLSQWVRLKKTVLFITHDVEEAIFLSKKILIIQDRPVTRLYEVEVPLGYPRNRSMLKEKNIVEMKEELIQKLRQEVEV